MPHSRSLLLAAILIVSSIAHADEPNLPQVFGINPSALAKSKARIAVKDAALLPAYEQLLKEADEALATKPQTVMDKPRPGASGDKHDYYSLATYFWPDPAKPDGRPYIRKDGYVNPETKSEFCDRPRLTVMIKATETLALAYYLSNDERYAEHAAKLLRVWFLDEATRMNPNLNQGQAIPGINNGRGIGIIDTHYLTNTCDAINLLAGSKHWTAGDQEGIEQWFKDYLEWLLKSKIGRDEASQTNNHRSYYDLQCAHFALFTGQSDLTKEIIKDFREKRLPGQLKPDGSQPLELAREDGYLYSYFNLQAYFALATLGERVGVDLWQHKTPDGATIRAAFDFLLPYVEDQDKKWPYEKSKPPERTLDAVLRQAYAVYGEERYKKLLEKSPEAAKRRDVFYIAAPSNN